LQHCCIKLKKRSNRIVSLCLLVIALAINGFAQEAFESWLMTDDTSKVLQVLEITVTKKNTVHPSTVAITELELELHQGLSLADAMEKTVGVSTIRTGNAIAKPVINGMFGNRLQLYSQGTRLEGQQWGDEHAPEIDASRLSSINVYQGANALVYASDAFGGVVMLESSPLNQIGRKLSGKWQNAGFYNGRGGSSSLMLEGKSQRFTGIYWRTHGSAKRMGDYRTPDYFVPNSGLKELNFSMEGGLFKEKFSIALFYSQYTNTVGVTPWSHIGNLTDLYDVLSNNLVRPEGEFNNAISRPNQRIAHELMKGNMQFYFKKDRIVAINVSRQYNLRQEYDLHTPWTPTPVGAISPSVQFELLTFSGDVILSQQRKRSISKVGVQGSHMGNVSNGRFFIPNYIRKQLGGFFHHKVILKNWEFQGTFRYDINQLTAYFWANDSIETKRNNNTDFSGALEAAFKWSEQGRIFIGYSRMWRAPGINELYSRGLHHGTASYEEGNALLNPEVMHQLTVGLTYATTKWNFSLVPFVSYINDYIYLQPALTPVLSINGAFPAFYYAQSNAWYSGFRYALNHEKNKQGFAFGHRAQFLHVLDAQSKEYIVGIPPTSFITEIVYFPTLEKLKKNDFFTGINWSHTATQWRITAERDYVASPEAFHLFGVTAGAKLPVKESILHIGLSIENIFNTTYQNYMNRLRYYLHEPGRQVSLRLNFKF
jgi:iron complex outermembrane recepter protein